jgi:hypothetical protein
MKSFSMFILCIAIVWNVFAQSNNAVNIYNRESVTVYKAATQLYTNTDNVLRIEAADKSVKRLWIEATNAEVHMDKSDYIVHPKTAGEVILKIYDDSDRTNRKLLQTQTLKAIEVPSWNVAIVGKNGGSISKADLMKAETLDVICSSCKEEMPEVTECKISVTGKDVPYEEFAMKGNFLTENIKEAFGNMPVGSKFYVEYIKAKASHDQASTRMLSPLTFIITD